AACAAPHAAATKHLEPFELKPVAGTDSVQITVAKLSVQRIGITTATVREVAVGETARKVVDYGAVVYLPSGLTSVYTNPKPLVFVRQSITIESIDGNTAVLSDGPPLGTRVVTVGAAQLLGMEFGVGK
ncbi:MAG: hypothetical protein QOF21_311, partial [Actinomycetota bacterium]